MSWWPIVILLEPNGRELIDVRFIWHTSGASVADWSSLQDLSETAHQRNLKQCWDYYQTFGVINIGYLVLIVRNKSSGQNDIGPLSAPWLRAEWLAIKFHAGEKPYDCSRRRDGQLELGLGLKSSLCFGVSGCISVAMESDLLLSLAKRVPWTLALYLNLLTSLLICLTIFFSCSIILVLFFFFSVWFFLSFSSFPFLFFQSFSKTISHWKS